MSIRQWRPEVGYCAMKQRNASRTWRRGQSTGRAVFEGVRLVAMGSRRPAPMARCAVRGARRPVGQGPWARARDARGRTFHLAFCTSLIRLDHASELHRSFSTLSSAFGWAAEGKTALHAQHCSHALQVLRKVQLWHDESISAQCDYEHGLEYE